MTVFNPGDKVIKRAETDAKNHGEVMDIPSMQQKEGYTAVYFRRHVWIKPENLMHFDEWKAQRRSQTKKQSATSKLADYWKQPPRVQGNLRKSVVKE